MASNTVDDPILAHQGAHWMRKRTPKESRTETETTSNDSAASEDTNGTTATTSRADQPLIPHPPPLPPKTAKETELETEKQRKKKSMVSKVLVKRANLLLKADIVRNEVLPYREKARRQFVTFRLRRVVSPAEFYLEYDTETPHDNYQFEVWSRKMQEFYNCSEDLQRFELVSWLNDIKFKF